MGSDSIVAVALVLTVGLVGFWVWTLARWGARRRWMTAAERAEIRNFVRKWWGSALLFALPFVAGCGVNSFFYVDERFSESERAEIQAAADYWDRATGGACHVDFVFGARVNFGKASHEGSRVLIRATEEQALHSGHPAISEHGRFGVRWLDYDDLGVARQSEGIAIVPSRIPERYPLRLAVAHELGHHFDANHTSDPTSLMAIDTPWTAERFVDQGCLSPSDVAELCNAADCSRVTECAP